MNNEDMSDIIQKLSNMMNNSNNSDSVNNENINDISSSSNETSYNAIQDILSNMNFDSKESENENSNSDNNFNFDFETIMKMKNIIDKFNSCKNSPETNLLLSLKPYLNNNRKQKIDQYIQFLKIAKVLESLNSNGEVNIK